MNGQHHCTSTAIVDTIQLSRRTDANMANNMANNMVNNMDINNMVKTDSANVSECTECNDTLSTCSRCDALLLDV